MEDGKIIELYWGRDERAIAVTGEKYGTHCYGIAYRILANREDAEECVNDTWMRAWNSMPTERPDYLKMFLARITRNLSLDKWREKTAQKRGGGTLELILEELEECIPGKSNVEEEVLEKELGQSINTFLHTLPKRECGIFIRRYFFAEETAMIAERYEVKESYVLVLLSRIRKKLREYLKKEGFVNE